MALNTLLNSKENAETNYGLIFNSIFMDSEIGMVILNADFQLVKWNPWFTLHSGIQDQGVIGKKLTEIFPVLNKGSVERAIYSALKDGMSSLVSHRLNRKPFPLKNKIGDPIHQQIVVKPIVLEQHQRLCLIQITNVSAAVNREKQLLEQAKRMQAMSEKLVREKERVQVTLDSIADAVITTDAKGKILSMNPIAEMLTGILDDDAKGKAVSQVFKLIYENTHAEVDCPVVQCLASQEIIVNEYEHILLGELGQFSITDSVAPIFDEDHNILGTILVFRDVSQSRALSAKLNWQALHDPLTGLANRRQFDISMKELLDEARTGISKHHLLYLDLDQFKVVNDTCGHDAGDELLKQITLTLQGKIRKTDLLARLGGDEFGVLLESCDASHALTVANNIRKEVESFRFGWQTQSFKIGVSIGIAEITGEEQKAAEILSAADAACYVAKESGRNRVHFHQLNESGSSAHQKEMQWISRIQAALDGDRFELYLQRIQDASDLSVASMHYEVLLRMVDEDGSIIPPGAFLPAAERFNLIGSLDHWVIENVFKKLTQLKSKTCLNGDLHLSINLSGASMADNRLLGKIKALLDRPGFQAKHFCFEVTETAAIANLNQAINFLSRLRARGCKIALDDFGSGLSSFTYLKSFPIDFIKIDGYFVKDVAIDEIDKVFVESINQIGQVMGLETIAEFVENDAILNKLTKIGVNHAQGYGIHKPCPFDEVFYLHCDG